MMRMRRGPGLVRTAAVVGTATAVSGRVARRQSQKFAAQDQAAYDQQAAAQAPPEMPAAPAAAPAQDDTIEQIKQLAALKDQGILTEEEFTAKKDQILGI